MISKKILHLFLFTINFTLVTYAQHKTEVIVLGTSHYNLPQDSVDQYLVVEKLKAFSPDMVMGEFVSPLEYKKLPEESYRRKMNDSTLAFYRDLNEDLKKDEKRLHRDAQKLVKTPFLHRLRIDLAAAYLNSYDLANAQYQIYQLIVGAKSHFNSDELAYFYKRLGGVDSLISKRLYIPTSEYHTILFPVMKAQGLPEIYPIDCQVYDLEWTQAWKIVAYCMHYIHRIAKMDIHSEEAKIVHKIQEEKEKLYAESDSLGLHGYAYLNSIFNAEESDIVNFYGGEKLFGFSTNYPEKEVKEMISYWKKRNEGMAQHVLDLINIHRPAKVVVAAGSAHQKWIEDVLSKHEHIQIVNFNDL